MSYEYQVLKDLPKGLWMLEDNLNDHSGRNVAATLVSGTSSAFIPPLVYGATRTMDLATGTAVVSFPFNNAQTGSERQPFSIETWVLPKGTSDTSLANGVNMGIYNTSGLLEFRLPLTTGTVSISHRPKVTKKLHIVATYTGKAMNLFVNGKLEASYDFTEAQLADTFNFSGTTLSHGGSGSRQAVAFYDIDMPVQVVKKHWEVGNKNAGSKIAAQLYGGRYIEVSPRTSNIFGQKLWSADNWVKGTYDCKITDVLSSAVDDTGAYLASSWKDTFELSAGGTNIDGVQIDWESKGTVTVEISVDNGANWYAATNTRRVPIITSGFNPTGKSLAVRVTFTAGVYGEVSQINLTGFTNRIINTSAQLPASRPANSTVFPLKEMNLFDDTTEMNFTGALSIGPNTEDSAPPVKTLNFWYWIPSGTVAVAGMGSLTGFYENGLSSAIVIKQGIWTMCTCIQSAGTSSAITITGGGIKLAYVSIWPDVLTAAQILTMYRSFLGKNTIVSSTTDSLGTITEGDAQLYANDWSISKAGV